MLLIFSVSNATKGMAYNCPEQPQVEMNRREYSFGTLAPEKYVYFILSGS